MRFLAVAYLKIERYTTAKELLEELTQINPDDGQAHQYLGYCNLRLKKLNEAIESYKTAIRIDEEDWAAYKGLGVAYMLGAVANDDNDLKRKAIEQWNISLEVNPAQPKLVRLLERYTED